MRLAIAHSLHSSRLGHLGIVAPVRSFCEEYVEHQKIEIDFSHDDIPREIPQDVLLCLFRIVQEALANAVKHSGVRHFEVQLYRKGDEIGLRVSDSGVGFDPETVKNQSGLGLISMRERLRLVHGTIFIESKSNSVQPSEPRCPDYKGQTARRGVTRRPLRRLLYTSPLRLGVHHLMFGAGELNSYWDYYRRLNAVWAFTEPIPVSSITDREPIFPLGKDSPEPRSIQAPEMGSVVAVSQVGGLDTASNDGPPETEIPLLKYRCGKQEL